MFIDFKYNLSSLSNKVYNNNFLFYFNFDCFFNYNQLFYFAFYYILFIYINISTNYKVFFAWLNLFYNFLILCNMFFYIFSVFFHKKNSMI